MEYVTSQCSSEMDGLDIPVEGEGGVSLNSPDMCQKGNSR